ncbi:MAG: TlpA disulfide reductase family protein [Daejeonella sp.]
MKAKRSLMAVLWPLIKQITQVKYRLLRTRNTNNGSKKRLLPDLNQVYAETKRIREKLNETLDREERCKLENKYLGIMPIPESKPEPKIEDNKVLFGWYEGEEDLGSPNDYGFWNYRQNLLRADQQEIMDCNLLALFKVDHDEGQFEQYLLENNLSPTDEVANAIINLRRFLSRGVYFLLTVVFIIGAGSTKVKAQESKAANLKVGDQMPDVTIQNLINYSANFAKVSDFKGKLLILDFWATWCSSCIKKFPALEALQKDLADDLQILLVNTKSSRDTELKVRDLFNKRHKEGEAPFSLPSAIQDTLLDALFPHQLIPHYVWVGPDGTVKAITSGDQVTKENIQKMLSGSDQQIAEKKDVDMSRPIFSSDAMPLNSLLHYSTYLQGKFEGLPSGTRFRIKDGIINGRVFTNLPVLIMYDLTSRELYPDLLVRDIVAEVRDLTQLRSESSSMSVNDWEKNNLYSYELQVPLNLADQLQQFILADLNRYSDYEGKLEKRSMDCLLIKRTPSFRAVPAVQQFKVSLERLSKIMNSDDGPGVPVLDETGLDKKFFVSKPENIKTRAALKNYLAGIGLYAEEAQRDFMVFVLRDNKEAE